MASKIFLDANIILDFTLKRESYEVSKKIIALVVHREYEAFITPAVIHIVGYWLTKAYGVEKAKELLLTLLSDIQVIDISHSITLNALHSKIRDIEDALQYYTALHHQLDYFISRDKRLQKDGIPALPVYTPEQFVKLFSL